MNKEKKIMVLGGGSSQINLIKECVSQGYNTILADINENAPGRVFATNFAKASTFDIDAVTQAAVKLGIDAVLTAGTDQPVLTAASVAEEMNLPRFLSRKTALSVTNKRIMKSLFRKHGMKTSPFAMIQKGFSDNELSDLKPPFVIKPFDSQGQRGVFKVDTVTEIRQLFDTTVSFSREEMILIEEYYDSDEITVSGWVCNGSVYIFSVTDRVTFNNYPTIGVCSAHTFPSPYSSAYRDSIIETTVSVTDNFGIKNGPIYFQYLIGDRGLIINEIACRLGGAYEDEFIPLLTGIDIRKLLIKGSSGVKITEDDFKNLKPYKINSYGKYVSVPLFFCSRGVIHRQIKPDSSSIESLQSFSYLHSPGTEINNINNSTQRAGYAVLLSDNFSKLNYDIEKLFNLSSVENKQGFNMLMDKTDQALYKEIRRFC